MKNTFKLNAIAGFIVLATIIGFSFASCEEEKEKDDTVKGFAGTYKGTSFEFSSSQDYGGQMGESDYLSGNASAITLTVVSDTNVSTTNEGGLFKLYGGGNYYGVDWANKTAGTFIFTSKPISGGSFTPYKPEPPSFLQPINTTFSGIYNSTDDTLTLTLTYWESPAVYTSGKLVLTKQP